MDGEKKRKRSENGGVSNRDRRKHGREAAVDDDSAAVPPPSEAEVEEFFAILRRMRVAVKYLEGSSQIQPNNTDHKLTASEAGATSGEDRTVRRGGLDLNTLPGD